jgi:hypothetical protein
MRTSLAAVFVLALLAACAGDPPRRSPAAAPPGPPRVDWQARVSGDQVVVTLADPGGHYRVQRVDLIGPGGRAATAHDLTRHATSAGPGAGDPYDRPGVGVSGGYGSGHGGHGGVGITIPLGGPSRPAARDAPGARTVARVSMPDPIAYRLAPDRWTIRVTLTDRAGNPSTTDIPAPRPAGD